MYNNKMQWPSYTTGGSPTMVSPAMQGPGLGTTPNMGYPGGFPGAGYPGFPTGVGGVTSTMPGVNAPPPGLPTMVSPAMQGPGLEAMPNMGYPGGFPGAGSGGFPGAGYPGYMTGVGGVTSTMTGVTAPPPVPSGAQMAPDGTVLPSATGQEESYVENILRMNLGKVATIYMTFENNCEWNAKVFKGMLEAAGRDHVIISDPTTGRRFLLLMVNLDYVTFDGPLTYSLPFGSMPGTGGGFGGGLTRSE